MVMSWEAIGTIAEVVGALAVVLSLLYVAAQIKQNTATSRAQAINQANSQYGALMLQIALNRDLAEIYRIATEGGDLGPVRATRYNAYLSAFFAYVEEVYLIHQAGWYAEDLAGTDLVRFLSPTIHRLLSGPTAREWWREEAANIYVPEFCQRVNEVTGLFTNPPREP